MNKRNKEVEAAKLRSEDRVLKDLKREYNEVAKRIKQNIKDLAEREQSQSVIYQAKYQEQLLNQINNALNSLDTASTVSDYLKDSYYNGFMGSLYDIQGQGIPIILPFDQNAITKMISTTGDNIKLSRKLYSNLTALKNRVRKEVSMGIAAGEMYEQVASRIDRAANIGFNNAYRIARTEGHRVSQASALDAMQGAKDSGANVVKQWDATLDGDTRKEHRELDGQIVEIDERFEVKGRKAKHPGGFGRPELDINCRCTMLQRAKWALDEDELDRLKSRAEFFDLDKSKSFEDFKEKYLKAAEQVSPKGNLIEWKEAKTIKEAEKFVRETLQIECSFKGLDVRAVNEMTKSVTEHLNRFPKLKDNFKFIGSAQENNKLRKAALEKFYMNDMGDIWDKYGYSETEKAKRARELAARVVGRSSNEWAWSFSAQGNEQRKWFPYVKDYLGICMNNNKWKPSEFDKQLRSLKYGVEIEFHPQGTENVQSIFDHEIGHQLDSLLRLRENKEFVDYYSKLSKEDIRDGLSGYATNNQAEFIAEAWSEYLNNPEPREHARFVGELIERLYKELK